MNRAGHVEIEVNGPYPCWCELKYKGESVLTIRHDELSDLRYVVEKAMQEARMKLGKDRDEVQPVL